MRSLIIPILFLLIFGCATVNSVRGPLIFQVKFSGEDCPDSLVWYWGNNESPTIQTIKDCGRQIIRQRHNFKSHTPREVKVEIYSKGRLLVIDNLFVAP